MLLKAEDVILGVTDVKGAVFMALKDVDEEGHADQTGLEPATSAVTGRHSNQLNYWSGFSV